MSNKTVYIIFAIMGLAIAGFAGYKIFK